MQIMISMILYINNSGILSLATYQGVYFSYDKKETWKLVSHIGCFAIIKQYMLLPTASWIFELCEEYDFNQEAY